MDESTKQHYSNLASKDADQIPIHNFMQSVSYDITYVKSSMDDLKTEYKQDMQNLRAEVQSSKDLSLMQIQFLIAILACVLLAAVTHLIATILKHRQTKQE